MHFLFFLLRIARYFEKNISKQYDAILDILWRSSNSRLQIVSKEKINRYYGQKALLVSVPKHKPYISSPHLEEI